MKLTVRKEDIIAGLQKVQSAVALRTTLPVLGNVLVRAEEDGLHLAASDLAMTVTAKVPATVSKTGATTLPAKKLFSIVRELAGEEIELESNEREVTKVKSASAVFHLNGISADDFPVLPKVEESRALSIDRAVLRGMLQRTVYAASTEENRQVLNGVFVSLRDGRLTVVATDGRRLAMVEQEMEAAREPMEMIVPTRAVNEMIVLLDGEGQAILKSTDNLLAVQLDDAVLYSRLVEGSYPNYRQVIPAQCEQRIALEREQFLTSVRRVALLTDQNNNSVKLHLSKNKIEITAQMPEVGEAKEAVQVKYGGADMTISFNPGFLTDVLKSLVTDQVYLEFNDDTSPGLIKTDEPFLYVIMPMRN